MQGYISERSALRRALNESELTENASLAQTATAVPHQQNFNWRLAQRELALTLMIAAEIPTPKTYSQAMSSNYADKWEGAVKRELGSLHEKSVWKVVPLPKGAKLVGMKWVFKVKQDENGHVSKFKARLVCQGFRQTFGVDCFETCAPVADCTTIRVMLALAAHNDWEIQQMDVDTAFLYGEMTEKVYCRAPPGVSNVPHGHALLLLKGLYGTYQARSKKLESQHPCYARRANENATLPM